MDAFLENAQRIFDVARSDAGAEPNDFALLIRPDGGLHFVMESPQDPALALEAAVHGEARSAYRITKTSEGGVRVTGRSGSRECVFAVSGGAVRPGGAARSSAGYRFSAELLRDQPLYRISSPPALSASS